jgi:voltage-gated potassium channel
MLVPRLERLKLPPMPVHPATTRAWREWCFWRALLVRFRGRAAFLLTIIAAAVLVLWRHQPTEQRDAGAAAYSTLMLVLGNPTDPLPAAPLARVMYFGLPIAGLLFVINWIVEFALAAGDRRRSERSWCAMMAGSMSDHIVLVGLGRLGYRIFRFLRKIGEAVVVVESNPANQFLDAVRRDGAPVIIADARRDEVLAEANVAGAKSLIVASNDDLANLEIALDARRIKPTIRVILRMFDQNMADKVRDGFNIRIAMSQAALSAPTFAMAATDASIVGTQVVEDQLVVMQRWTVRGSGPLIDRTVGNVLSEMRFCVVNRQPRDGPARLFPAADEVLCDGDQLLVQGGYDALVELRGRNLGL